MRHWSRRWANAGFERAAHAAGRRGKSRAAAHCAEPDRVSPFCAAGRKGARIRFAPLGRSTQGAMAIADLERPKAIRGLPGATVLHILPALVETPTARAVVDTAVA